ncbi:NUDIX domain-containing protein [Rossellomorea marisflavi]|uniref:NUDIX domain-containing protein n=1 Tax=Rossellomorea marisflavi TaxID=189381 RepID=UPI001EE3089B|nr:NUDIX domain-containing protein [Rossellomorea marisflavi]UKS64417.1 NUDIX domain-containing protein [Rossellomorea marisflavi]
MSIRNSAKALFMKEGAVLLTKNQDEEGFFYLFPGGGQEKGETLEEAVVRECQEEIGSTVRVGPLKHVREYIGKNHEHAFDAGFQQVEFYFECHLLGEEGYEPTNPDSHQVGIEWVSLDEWDGLRIYPKALGEYIKGHRSGVYVGDIN